MKRRVAYLSCLGAVLLSGSLVSCQDSAVQPPGIFDIVPDTPDLEVDSGDLLLDPDDGDVVDPEYESCDENEDCESLLCILTQEGSVCTEPCVSECPKGYKCQVASTGSADPFFICLPAYLTLCFPCNEAKDCTTVPGSPVVYQGIQCISQGEAGSFCGGVCETAEDCPEDFDCQEADGPVKQCVPVSGECGCSNLSESLGVTSQCYVEDEDGNRCTGDIQCSEGVLTDCPAALPTVEICDGEDNDCDGDIDNGLTVPAGDLQGGVCLGSEKVCGGTEGWQEPNYTLIGAYEDVEQTCDGKDNDCEGTVDNGLVAPSADIQLGECAGAVKLCLGASGWAEPNYGAIPTYETTETLCDGLDNDCDGEVDEVNLYAPLASHQSGVCEGVTQVCAGTEGWVEPDYSTIEGYEADETLCDDKDNDCDEVVDEGYLPGGGTVYTDTDGNDLAKSEACGVGQCAGGEVVCGADQVSLTCSTVQNAVPDTCDGFDNDCDPATLDGADDPNIGVECDGDDSDQCKESTKTCIGGILSCLDTDDDDLDICDGVDNDCNPATADGFGDPQLGTACDGDGDDDLCKEGKRVCLGGTLSCDDINDPDPDHCDGQDNDCNPATPDGADDPNVGTDCDGDDSDQCKEGKSICSNGQVTCPDTDDDDPDICDGQDNDCNPLTVDGSQDPDLGANCDGSDADLCDEGIQLCVGGSLSCTDSNDVNLDVCDGVDNDCDPSTVDGSQDPKLGDACDGDDTDQCNEGTKICTGDSLACNDPNTVNVEVCDGADNDCNPLTVDGSQDPQLNTLCDGDDADLCNEGTKLCAGGSLTCTDSNNVNVEICDGVDNDCNPGTADGSQDPQLNAACDGADADNCEEGTKVCTGGSLSCNDPNDANVEVCDGADNDCNPLTVDGSQDPQLNAACDGIDADNCNEGAKVCVGGNLTCNDPNDLDKDVCDGSDNDCNPLTIDGSQDPQLNVPCDGSDADLCNEGFKVCTGGSLSCDDPNDLDLDVCDGSDNDCNPATADGSQDPQFGASCDGNDPDLCPEGIRLCSGGSLTCNDPNDLDQEVCDGVDNDCDPSTLDGSQDSQLGDACDGTDADLCDEGSKVCTSGSLTCNDANDVDLDSCDNGVDNDCDPNTIDGSQATSNWSPSCSGVGVSVGKVTSAVVATGGFNRTTPVDWIKFTFTAPPAKTNFHRKLTLSGTGYAMAVHRTCNSAYTNCAGEASQVDQWQLLYTYSQGTSGDGGTGCCTDDVAKANTVYVRVFRTALTSICQNYSITAKNTW